MGDRGWFARYQLASIRGGKVQDIPGSSSFSQVTRSPLLAGGDGAAQRVPQGFSHCLNGLGAQLHGFYSLPKPGKHPLAPSRAEWPRDACYDHPRPPGPEGPPRRPAPASG
ncbi:hypothetical protein AGOR_G00030990 [Albula goreensis]|uniref:Uncharacterized protein n=1 Tax=Albula goreensis TaxID=1534307 RepID=A0A8T3E9T7_9TELE|nr:hypothetical protein AGOR_G00030990 [Albula goreensis]